jgi:nitrogen-specific signal transduction histidine kinase
LKRAQDNLVESERLKAASRLAHELAHQLNNPLQALRNSLYLLQSDFEPERHDEYLKLADATLSRIESLARAILLLEGNALVQNSRYQNHWPKEKF